MQFRHAKVEDLSAIMDIIKMAQAQLKDAGIDQWQNQYPNEEIILLDINNNNSYVVTLDNQVVATVAFAFAEDENYRIPVEGSWTTKLPYAVIHRIAIHSGFQGKDIGSFLMEQLIGLARLKGTSAIRVDTHHENQRMQRYLLKHGFTYMGVIKLQDGNLRDAFERAIV